MRGAAVSISSYNERGGGVPFGVLFAQFVSITVFLYLCNIFAFVAHFSDSPPVTPVGASLLDPRGPCWLNAASLLRSRDPGQAPFREATDTTLPPDWLVG
ncbi:hypothetical protein ACOMHN_053413 [Nucella lapillus]